VLLYLLEDSLAVQPEAPDALIQVNELCGQLRDTSNPHLRVAAIAAELLSGEEADEAYAGALCDEPAELQRSFEDPYREEEGEWVPNFRYCKDPVWRPLMGQRKDKKRWTTLMEARFPKQPGSAASMRERFLATEN